MQHGDSSVPVTIGLRKRVASRRLIEVSLERRTLCVDVLSRDPVCREIVIGQLPLRCPESALEFLPLAFDVIPVHRPCLS